MNPIKEPKRMPAKEYEALAHALFQWRHVTYSRYIRHLPQPARGEHLRTQLSRHARISATGH